MLFKSCSGINTRLPSRHSFLVPQTSLIPRVSTAMKIHLELYELPSSIYPPLIHTETVLFIPGIQNSELSQKVVENMIA